MLVTASRSSVVSAARSSGLVREFTASPRKSSVVSTWT